jgi:hypothetical protein
VRLSQALRDWLLHLAAADETTPEGQTETAAADDILVVLIDHPEVAGRCLLALGSITVFAWFDAGIDPQDGVSKLTTSGDVIADFAPFLQALVDAYRAGEKLSETAILLSSRIAGNREECSLALWVLGTWLTLAAKGNLVPFVDAFIASSLRQGLISDVELDKLG